MNNPEIKNKQIIKPKILLKSLDGESFLKTYKELPLILGSATSLYFSCLIDKYNYFENRGMLIEGEYFYTTKNWIEFETGLAQTNQSKHSEKLEELGLIKTKYITLPGQLRRKCYSIEDNIINELMTALNILKNDILFEKGKLTLNDTTFKKYKQALKEIKINGKNPYEIKTTYNTGDSKLTLIKNEVRSRVECSDSVQGLNEGYVQGLNDEHSGVERQIRLNNKTNNNENKELRETESFPGISLNTNTLGKEKDMEKFNLGKSKSFYEEKLYKEYSPVLEEFKNFGFSLKFKKESKTPEYLYGHFQSLAAGEFKQKLKPEQREKLQDFRKLDSPQPVERLAKYVKKALTVFEKIRTDESYWPKDKSKLQKLSISDFLLSQKKFSWLMYCLDNPEPMERQDYQLSAVKKKFEKLKISELTIVRNLYNNHSDVEHFTEKQWTEVYFSLNSIFDYIEKNEEALAGKGAYETPRTFLDLMGSWNQAQNKMVTNFGIGSAPWQWFNDWLKQSLGFNMIVKKQREKAPEVVKKEIEFAAIEFFTETYNGFFRGEMKGAESAAIEARTLALTLDKFPGISREVLRIEQG